MAEGLVADDFPHFQVCRMSNPLHHFLTYLQAICLLIIRALTPHSNHARISR